MRTYRIPTRILLATALLLLATATHAQTPIPKITYHPELNDNVSTSIIDEFIADPYEGISAILLNLWTFSQSPWDCYDCGSCPNCDAEWRFHPLKLRYGNIQGLINLGYTLGTFAYHPTPGYGPTDDEGEIDTMLHHRFVVSLPGGSEGGVIDEAGYAAVPGNLFQNSSTTQLDPMNASVFLVKSTTANLFKMDGTDLYLKGKLYEDKVNLDSITSVKCFRVKNASGTTVALVNDAAFTNSAIETVSPYIVPAGSLILKEKMIALNIEH